MSTQLPVCIKLYYSFKLTESPKWWLTRPSANTNPQWPCISFAKKNRNILLPSTSCSLYFSLLLVLLALSPAPSCWSSLPSLPLHPATSSISYTFPSPSPHFPYLLPPFPPLSELSWTHLYSVRLACPCHGGCILHRGHKHSPHCGGHIASAASRVTTLPLARPNLRCSVCYCRSSGWPRGPRCQSPSGGTWRSLTAWRNCSVRFPGRIRKRHANLLSMQSWLIK